MVRPGRALYSSTMTSSSMVSLDSAIKAVLETDRGAIPGFVRPARETLGKPDLQQPFLDRCRHSLHTLISGQRWVLCAAASFGLFALRCSVS